MGSIPAGAGEPLAPSSCFTWAGVYPRGCGGAQGVVLGLQTDQGLSPRVRGSRFANPVAAPDLGSIPAGAGEPDCSGCKHRHAGVYPRGCGGAPEGLRGCAEQPGLSPRVRGSQPVLHGQQAGRGSIPAGAGEPSAGSAPNRGTRVYPRGCGGARLMSHSTPGKDGLSPRVRGSHLRHGRNHGLDGSIPAGAGEPVRHVPRVQKIRVYPRGCGGAPLGPAKRWA